jgi:hypothetical protein
MSEIIKKIEAGITGKRYAQELPPLLVVNSEMHKPAHNPFLTEYFVGVKLGHTIRVDDERPDQKEEATYAIKRALTELIFGEFRSDLVRLQYQLYDRDFDQALRTAKEIEQRMFYS